MQKNEKSGEIDDAAARWAVRIDRGPLTQTEELALDQWLSHDSRHQGALVRAQALLLPAQGAAELMPVGGARSQGAAFRTGWAAGITSVAAAVGLSLIHI